MKQDSGLNLFNPLYPVEYFPSRVGRVIVTAKLMGKGGIAAGCYVPETNVAHIPIEDSAYYRTVRRHEASHANLPPDAIRMTALFQGVEDMRIHTLGNGNLPDGRPMHNSRSRRDELVMAYTDLRKINRELATIPALPPTNVRLAMVMIGRALSILEFGYTHRRDGQTKPNHENRAKKMIRRILGVFEKAIGKTGIQLAISKATKALTIDDVAKATAIMRPYMTIAKDKDANLPKQSAPKPEKQPKQKPQQEQSPSPSISAEDDEQEPEEKESGQDEEQDEQSGSKSGESDESEEDADESEDEKSGDADSASNSSDSEEQDGEKEQDKAAGDSAGEEDGEGDSGDGEEQQGEDVPCAGSQYSDTGEKGGIGDLGEALQQAIEDNRLTSESVSLLDPKTLESILKAGQEFNAPLPKMEVIKLDYRMSKKITEGRSARLAFSGSRLRISRIPRVFDPIPGKVFERIGKSKGGTVLIDASGSMNLENERLARLAERIPIGQVAYYNGNGSYMGWLVIYSQNGRSFLLKDGESLPNIMGGNEVDFQALQWLLKQPEPRWLISDLEFVGPCEASNQAAFELVKRAYSRKLLNVYATLGELEIELKLKTELDDHDTMMKAAANVGRTLSPCPICNATGVSYNSSGRFAKCESCYGTGVKRRL